MQINKKINLELVGLDGNAFFLMGAFQKQAKRESWTEEEIDFVMKEAQSGDYNHLLSTLMVYCEPIDEDEYDKNDEDGD